MDEKCETLLDQTLMHLMTRYQEHGQLVELRASPPDARQIVAGRGVGPAVWEAPTVHPLFEDTVSTPAPTI
jgi:hypothetical protein